MKNASIMIEGPLLLLSVVNTVQAHQICQEIRACLDELFELHDIESYLRSAGRSVYEISQIQEHVAMEVATVADYMADTYPEGFDEFVRSFESTIFTINWALQGATGQSEVLLTKIQSLLIQTLEKYLQKSL